MIQHLSGRSLKKLKDNDFTYPFRSIKIRPMNEHHLILGTLTDFLTGKTIHDTLDERYRQNIARILVEEKGYQPSEIVKDYPLTVGATQKKAVLKIDFIVCVDGDNLMLIKYGPGSIVTRHRPALAASRLVGQTQIPCVVVTNGEESDILDGHSGNLLGRGLSSIPRRDDLARLALTAVRDTICGKRIELESRILYAFDVDGSCPCDTDICRIES